MRDKSNEPDINAVETETADFLSYYNRNVPDQFPLATLAALEKFIETHLSLFGKKKLWSRDKHRKRLMDWLFSYKD